MASRKRWSHSTFGEVPGGGGPAAKGRGMKRCRVLVTGMSHVAALERGWRDLPSSPGNVEMAFLDLRSAPARDAALAEFRQQACGSDAIVLMLRGNEHTVVGLANVGTRSEAADRLERDIREGMDAWLDALLRLTEVRTVMLPPPPPIEDIAPIFERKRALQEPAKRQVLGETGSLLKIHGLRPPGERLALWRHQCRLLSGIAAERGIELLSLPGAVFSESGMLSPDCCGETDLTHGNALYGRLVLNHVFAFLAAPGSHPPGARSSSHPYADLPDYAYWKQAVGERPAGSINPVVAPRLRLSRDDRIATAGSCFAQHLSRRLVIHGLNFMDVEPTAPGAHSFSAKYGNVYTSRQLLQLFQRAFGTFAPCETAWRRPDGRYVDPFRPRVIAEGHPDEGAVEQASRVHLDAVRRMFVELDLFVFTLGLTECWASRADGAVYPIAPGVIAGGFDSDRHAFLNLGHADVKRDMAQFLESLWSVNPEARVLLTVSPVPMVATRESRHVLVSNAESKAVLRSVAGELGRSDARVEYFPSYELIAGAHNRGEYFAPDNRSVTDAGVDHVMRVFLESYGLASGGTGPSAQDSAAMAAFDTLEAATDALCEEESYALGSRFPVR